jgi:hypothetical protein
MTERLHFAGLKGPSPFSDPAVERILLHSSGVPRLINLICDACLSVGFRAKRKTIQPDIVEEAAASMGLTTEAEVTETDKKTISFPTGGGDAPRSMVDLLIDAMKNNRAAATE